MTMDQQQSRQGNALRWTGEEARILEWGLRDPSKRPLDEASRRAFLEHALSSESYVAPNLDETVEKTSIHKEASSVVDLDIEANGGNDNYDAQDENESMGACCPICLDDFRQGDRISSSSTGQCHHTFHRDCILDWLLTDDTCPCCRQNFVTFESYTPVTTAKTVSATGTGRHNNNTNAEAIETADTVSESHETDSSSDEGDSEEGGAYLVDGDEEEASIHDVETDLNRRENESILAESRL